MLPLIDLAAETRPPQVASFREEVLALIEGVQAYTLQSCVQWTLRMLFDETGARPWEARNANKTLRATVALAASLWRGSRDGPLDVGDWLETTLQIEINAAHNPRAKLRYLLHGLPPCAPRPKAVGEME